MNQRLLNVVAAVAMLAGSIGSAAPALAAPPGPTYRPVDVGPRLRDLSPSEVPLHLNGFEGAYEQAASSSTQPQEYVEGDVITAIWYDDLSGLYLAPFEVRAIGEHIEVWVMTDLNFPDGDPRNPVVITDEQIDYLVDEFDNTIYPQEVAFFGAPDFHDGSNAALPFDYYDPEGRSIAMIMNVGDENYYDPNYPLYIAGFYWGAVFELYLDRNVISIDAYDWENRVGDDAARPNLYEGVFAHEYQHLLHDDYDSDEENWVNEACRTSPSSWLAMATRIRMSATPPRCRRTRWSCGKTRVRWRSCRIMATPTCICSICSSSSAAACYRTYSSIRATGLWEPTQRCLESQRRLPMCITNTHLGCT